MVLQYLAKKVGGEKLKIKISDFDAKGCKKFIPEKILLQLLLSDLHSITTTL